MSLKVVGNWPAFAGLPCFRVGKGHATDGMPYYVVMCPELFERPGSPYGDERGVDWQDNDVRFATFSYAAAQIALGSIDKDWSAHFVHANDWQCELIQAYLEWSQRPLPLAASSPTRPSTATQSSPKQTIKSTRLKSIRQPSEPSSAKS